jgi:protein SCO1
MKIRRLFLRLGFAALLGFAFTAAAANAAALVEPPRTEISQQLDVALPLELPFSDAEGRPVRLGTYFADGRPVILVLGYYRCPNLCGLTMHGILEALDASGLPHSDWRIVAVSIDPDETPADARARERVYVDYATFLRRDRPAARPLDLQLLVGPAPSIAALSERIGFAYQRDAGAAQADSADAAAAASRYAHAAGFVVVTPDGRTSRYFFGVRFDARELHRALVDAAAGTIGSLSDRLVLLCAHFAPLAGRHDVAVMNGLRAVAALLVLGLGGWAWRHRHAPLGAQPR